MSEQELFWSKVDKSGDCWIWNGTRRLGYGMINFKRDGVWKSYSAHRLSYEWAYEHPGKNFVCHTCDNPPCVNPEHLFLGSHTDNMHDMFSKDRGHSKITKQEVIEARTMYSQGMTMHEISEAIDVELQCTARAVRGITWSHLTEPPPIPDAEVEFIRVSRPTLSLEDIADIRKALETPYWGINRDLCAKYGCHPSAISHIKKGSYGKLSF
jgi:hypothetical protein